MRARRWGIVVVVVACVGLAACTTPSNMDLERRTAAHAYRTERPGEPPAVPSEARCELVGRYTTFGGMVHTSSRCTVRDLTYDLLSPYNNGTMPVTVVAYQEGRGAPKVADCTFRPVTAGPVGQWPSRWEWRACRTGPAVPRLGP